MSFFVGQLGNRVAFSVGKYFFDRDRVVNGMNRRDRGRLSKAGAWVRRAARSSIRQARRKRVSELNDSERAVWFARLSEARAQGRPVPRQPWWFAPSKPGEPPRSVWGLLRNHIYFVYDPDRRSVVIGPAKLQGTKGEAPHALEFGGNVTNRQGRRAYIEPRPYMRPARDSVIDDFPELYRNSLE